MCDNIVCKRVVSDNVVCERVVCDRAAGTDGGRRTSDVGRECTTKKKKDRLRSVYSDKHQKLQVVASVLRSEARSLRSLVAPVLHPTGHQLRPPHQIST